MFILINDKLCFLTTTILLHSREKLFACNLFHNSIAMYHVGKDSWERRGSRWTNEEQYSMNGEYKIARGAVVIV